MLSIMITAFQGVPLLQPGGVWQTLPQDRHFSSVLSLEFSKVPIVAQQKRNVCYFCPMGIIYNFLLDHYPKSCIFKAKNIASARCLSEKD